MTLADFLAWEEQQPERHEFVDGEVFAMVGASLVHGLIAGNLYSILRQRLPKHCLVFQEGAKVCTASASFYPDVVVRCDPLRRGERLIERPTLLAEVLSPSTEPYDRGKKWAHYRDGFPSLQTYVLVSQAEALVELYRRNPDGWQYSAHRGLSEAITLHQPPCSFTVAEVYERTLEYLGADGDPA